MADYNAILREELDAAESEAQEYKKKKLDSANAYADKVKQVYGDLVKTAETQYNKSANETARSYRSAYDDNAVSELVARRNATEAMANAGLTNSGLNATQNTAISIMRGNADKQTTSQKQSAVDSIMAELDKLRSQYNGESASKQASIYDSANDDIASNRLSIMNNAKTSAATRYNNELAAEQAQYEAQLAAEKEAYERQKAAAELQLEYDKLNKSSSTDTSGSSSTSDGQNAIGYSRNTLYKNNGTNTYMYNGKNLSKTASTPLSPEQIRVQAQQLSKAGNDADSVINYINAMAYKNGYTAAETADIIKQAGLTV